MEDQISAPQPKRSRMATSLLCSISDAVLAQDWKTLQRLADSSGVLSWKDKHGSSILHYAAGAGHLEMCQWIVSLEVAACPKDSPLSVSTTMTSKNGRTPLHWAARNGHTTLCQFLVRTQHHHYHNCPVDILAKGDVTPLQLAVWQGHLQTCQVLVDELGADPHFVNGWGCGTAHWLGKCPNYPSKTDDDENNMRRMCVWLFEKCQVAWNVPNHHGQTPLHKAAFEGNLGVVQYLVWDKGVKDTLRDHQGNTAADCAERNQQYSTAVWLRKYASPLVHQALQILGIPREGSASSDGRRSTETYIVPPISDIRTRYLKLALNIHPDRQNKLTETGKDLPSWSNVQWAYYLLMTYWRNPQQYDVTIRIATRNQALQERLALCWYPEWHTMTEDDNITERSDLSTATPTANDETKTEKLSLFEQRLVSLLLTDAYRHKGLSLAQLPKEMKKTWNLTLHPKEYQCRKWIDLLQRKFHRTIHVQLDDDDKDRATTQEVCCVSAGPKQPRVFAKVSMPNAVKDQI